MSCTADVLVDGSVIGHVLNLGNTVSATLTAGTMHQAAYSNTSCQGGSALDSSYPAVFTDSVGAVSIPSPAYSGNTSFFINVR